MAEDQEIIDNLSDFEQEDLSFVVDDAQRGLRLDKLLALKFPEFSRGMLQNLIARGAVMAGGNVVKQSFKVASGDYINIEPGCFKPDPVEPQYIPLSVLFEDDDILVIDKQPGLTVHPSAGCPDHTLVNGLLYRNYEIFNGLDDGSRRPGIVHRLDRDTSGVMVIAKNAQSFANLKIQFMEHSVRKIYVAVLEGILPQASGRLETRMGKHPQKWYCRAVLPEGGKEAITQFRMLADNGQRSLAKVRIFTGRTHQIRVHMAYLGAPLAGDIQYGGHQPPQRQMLHAGVLEFSHPATGERLIFTSQPPADFLFEADMISQNIEWAEILK